MLNNKTLLKILSILIALGMWIMVVSGHEETKEMTVPVKLINVSGGKVAISDYPNVSITIKGAARLMQSLANSDVLLDIDVTVFPNGQSIRRILPADFKTPLGLEVIDVKPSELRITLDNIIKVVSKELNIKPSEIVSKERNRKVTFARRAVIYLAHSLMINSMNIIAKELGMKDHSSVSKALKAIKKEIAENSTTRNIIEDMKSKIQQSLDSV